MVMCWAPGCQHYNQKETCRFFKFPIKNLKERNKWKMMVKRNVEPGPGAFLCSCHFPEGKRENGPQFFKHNEAKRFQFSTPEKRKRQRKQIKVTCDSDPSQENDSNKVGSRKQLKFEEALIMEPQPSASWQDPTLTFEPQPSTSWQDPNETFEPQPSTSWQDPNETFEPQPSTSWQEPILKNIGLQSSTLTKKTIPPPFEVPPPVVSPPFASPVLIEATNYFLQQELSEKEQMLQNLSDRMSFERIKNNNDLILLYTGLPNASIFNHVFELLKDLKLNYYLKWKVNKINRQDQLLLTLMKLRQNYSHIELADRFGISQAAVSNVVITWIHVLHKVLFVKLMGNIPSRAQNKTCMPNCFSTFTNCRIIIDCTEIFTAVPRQSMMAQRSTYSSYKHRNTWKGLIGVAPNGVVTFVSSLYPGSTSDKKIVQNCGILNQLEPGDLILADKGFLIRDILPPGVALNIPPFLTSAQFTPEQVRQTECIARARIHVERAIRRMKVYKILNFIPTKLIPYSEEVFQCVAALTNLQYPLIKEVEQYFSAEIE